MEKTCAIYGEGFDELISSPRFSLKYPKCSSRVIILKAEDERNLWVDTDAPSVEIQNAIDFKNQYFYECDDWDEFFDSDFSVIQTYLKEKGFNFAETGSEEYWW